MRERTCLVAETDDLERRLVRVDSEVVGEDGDGERVRTAVETLNPADREEEIARMLAGAKITDAARAAARALMHV